MGKFSVGKEASTSFGESGSSLAWLDLWLDSKNRIEKRDILSAYMMVMVEMNACK